jgi:hypothetical protein
MLPADSTFVTIRQKMRNLEGQLRIVVKHMNACTKKHGNAHVRIGRMGDGVEPNHKVVYDLDGAEHLYGAFWLDREFSEKPAEGNTWSTTRMSYQEVRELLADETGFPIKA